jgi:Spy/CpxP family protein refolding chaperone
MNKILMVLVGTFMTVFCMATPVLAEDADDAPPYGHGWMGPGMMGGYGHGYGMMGGQGMGPGMMGGYGGGHDMMGGYGIGPYAMLNLSDDQRSKINKIHDAERKQHWAIMGKMMDKQNAQRDLLAQSEPDPKKVGAVYAEIAKLRQQMLETHVQANNDMQKVLTKEQREQMQQWRRGMWGGQGGAGSRGMMGR